MNRPDSPLISGTVSTAWPRSLVVPVATTLVLLAFFTTLELPGYVHGRGVPRITLPIVFVAYGLAINAWLFFATRASWFVNESIDRPGKWFRRQFRRLPLFILTFVVLGYGLRLLGFYFISGMTIRITSSYYGGLLAYEIVKASLVYCCWLGLAFGVLSFVKMRRQAEHLLSAQKALVEAKLLQLKGQLRPHFLFNTLNTISSLMQVDVARADRMVTQLGDLLRANLDMSDRDVVPLEQEIGLLKQYAGIMQERFVGRVAIDWRIDQAALSGVVPTMLLQPLLENAFKHGIERSTSAEAIEVNVERRSDRLAITIYNSGSTLAVNYEEGWGLRNCRERLRLLFGSSSLQLRNEREGVSAEINIPWVGPGDTFDVSLNAFNV